MITEQHLKIYSSYTGDGDSFVRFGLAYEKKIMHYVEWALIESLIQDIRLIKRGLASGEYLQRIKARLEENCENDTVIAGLEEVA